MRYEALLQSARHDQISLGSMGQGGTVKNECRGGQWGYGGVIRKASGMD